MANVGVSLTSGESLGPAEMARARYVAIAVPLDGTSAARKTEALAVERLRNAMPNTALLATFFREIMSKQAIDREGARARPVDGRP